MSCQVCCSRIHFCVACNGAHRDLRVLIHSFPTRRSFYLVRTAVDGLAALFPCGSVACAPKIRAMEVIAEIEKEPRRVYTGSIGWVGPGGEGGFNVAIRTLVIPEEPGPARLSVGSAVVADSTADDE